VSFILETRIEEISFCLILQRRQVKQQVSFEFKDIFQIILFYIQRQQPQVERQVSTISVKYS
jgi:hypothetical protein